MKLSERLQKIADEIGKGEAMADIGTDHGFLPIYLFQEGISPRVVLTDVSPGSLAKAREDLDRFGPGCREGISLRLGSGLSVLEPGEVETVVMAGMGGMLMTRLLGEDLAKTRTYRKFILQPRRHLGRLRCWLWDQGFTIEREQLARESHFIWPILTVLPEAEPGGGRTWEAGEAGEEDASSQSSAGILPPPCTCPEYEEDPVKRALADYPDALLSYGDPLLAAYLAREERIQTWILEKLPAGPGRDRDRTEARLRQLASLTAGLSADMFGKEEPC